MLSRRLKCGSGDLGLRVAREGAAWVRLPFEGSAIQSRPSPTGSRCLPPIPPRCRRTGNRNRPARRMDRRPASSEL